MKMGNITPRAGIEPTSLRSWVSVLTITPPRLPDVTIVPMPYLSAASCLRGQCKYYIKKHQYCAYAPDFTDI